MRGIPTFSISIRNFLKAYLESVSKNTRQIKTMTEEIFTRDDWVYSAWFPMPNTYILLSPEFDREGLNFAEFDVSFWTGKQLICVQLNQSKTMIAINILNYITDNLDKYDFDNHYMISNASSYQEILKFREDAANGNVDLLISYNANPVYNLSDSLNIQSALQKIPYKVSFSSTLDETSELSDLILPDQHPLEQWGDYEGKKNTRYIMQPTMKALYGNLSIGDSIVSIFNNVEPKNQKIVTSYVNHGINFCSSIPTLSTDFEICLSNLFGSVIIVLIVIKHLFYYNF